MDEARDVLEFWFGAPDDPQHGLPRAAWYRKDADFDASIARRFGPLIERGLAGALAPWGDGDNVEMALAEVLVLDQFTRNTLRGSARAFAGDARALAVAQALVSRGADRALTGVQRQFVYMPFEHAEDLAHQHTALRLFQQLQVDAPEVGQLATWAQKHLDVIARFGRFPHRNAALGRASSVQEVEFLAQPGSSF